MGVRFTPTAHWIHLSRPHALPPQVNTVFMKYFIEQKIAPCYNMSLTLFLQFAEFFSGTALQNVLHIQLCVCARTSMCLYVLHMKVI